MSKQQHYKKFICKLLTCWLPNDKRILCREALFWFSFSDMLRFKKTRNTIISLGTNCLPRGLTTAVKLKPRRCYGEKSCPFDLSINPDLKKITELIETDFIHFFDNLIINKKTFPHDYYMPYEKFVERYKSRIKNFKEIMHSDKILYFIHSDYEKIPKREDILQLYNVLKSKRNNKPFKLIILTYEYIDGLNDIIQIPLKFKIDHPVWLVSMIDEYDEFDNKYTRYRDKMKEEFQKIIV